MTLPATGESPRMDRSLSEQHGYDADRRALTLAHLDLDADDRALLRELAPLVTRHAGEMVEAFYAHLRRHPELEAVIEASGSSLARLKEAHHAYLESLFRADFDAEYFEHRLRIGQVHHRVGLTPNWYLSTFSLYFQLIGERVLERWRFRPAQVVRALAAVNKVLTLDAILALDTYAHAASHALQDAHVGREELARRLEDYRTLIRRVAEGDLTPRLAVHGDDPLSQLGGNLNAMVDGLADMTGKVAETSNAMLASLQQVRAALGAQSSGAAQQAAAVNETTATLEQIQATSQQTLDKVSRLKEVADRVKAEGEEGVEIVAATVAAMRDLRTGTDGIVQHFSELNQRLQQIGEITDTVDDLAQQSKMLALNASIEAARAGESGRGFVVVAEEMKELAEQSRQAARHVQRILDEVRAAAGRTVEAVEAGHQRTDAGAALAERAGEVMQDLDSVIRDTALAAQQIVAAVRQEAYGIEQIRGAMGDINSVTGQFLKATHETEQVADQITDYAIQLQGMVRRFKVENSHFDFELARAMHRTWVVRLESFLDGRGTLTEAEAVSHHHCQLGRWYDGEGLSRYGHIPDMRALEEPHRQLHELIHATVQDIHRGLQVDKRGVLQRVRELSERIVGHLDRIEATTRAGRPNAAEGG